MRPIDADGLLSLYENAGSLNIDAYKVPVPVVRQNIMDAPTLDYAPVRHGEFEMQEEEYFAGLHVTPVLCKTCNTTYFTMNKEGKRAICCPYCGAMMPEPPKEEK